MPRQARRPMRSPPFHVGAGAVMLAGMKIDVALLPSLLSSSRDAVIVVVDALRATSVVATLLARGVEEIAITASVEEGLDLKSRAMPDRLLCGEAGGLPPPGFDYGNSPSEFSRLELAGRRTILATSNGTRALVAAADAPAVFTGSLLNRVAVCRAAAAEARRLGAGLTFLCSGVELGRAFSLEDTGVCGALVEQTVSHHGGSLVDTLQGLTLTDGATAAYRLWRSYASPRMLMGEATHGQALARLGLSEDLDYCSQLDLYDIAPRLHRGADGSFALRAV